MREEKLREPAPCVYIPVMYSLRTSRGFSSAVYHSETNLFYLACADASFVLAILSLPPLLSNCVAFPLFFTILLYFSSNDNSSHVRSTHFGWKVWLTLAQDLCGRLKIPFGFSSPLHRLESSSTRLQNSEDSCSSLAVNQINN